MKQETDHGLGKRCWLIHLVEVVFVEHPLLIKDSFLLPLIVLNFLLGKRYYFSTYLLLKIILEESILTTTGYVLQYMVAAFFYEYTSLKDICI